MEGHAHARAQQSHPRPDQAVPGRADRAAVVHDTGSARAAALREPGARQSLPGPARRHREPVRGGPRAPRRRDRRVEDRVGSRAVSALLLAASTPSKVPFFIAGGAVAAWAVILAAIGLNRPEFPGNLRG